MRILLLGASGGTGRLLVEGALQRGHQVTAVARNLEPLKPLARTTQQLALARGDVRDEGALWSAAVGHDAAISVISRPVRGPRGFYTQATGTIIRVLEDAGVHRFVCVSSGGADPDDRGLPWWYRRVAIPLFMGELYRDMRQMEQLVRHSRLAWTLVRAAYLVDQPQRGRYRVSDGSNPQGGWKLGRADLAEFLLDQLDSSQWLRSTPTLAY
jgi:putative NADH-flavin reductase